ncbi:hypothetical protein CHUAL_000481 [Chamberlinius hualienensis]
MISFQFLLGFGFCTSLSFAFSSYISFDDYIYWPNETAGYSHEKLLKWTYEGHCKPITSPIIPGINGTSILIETSKHCRCHQLTIKPFDKNVITMYGNLFVSFWIYIPDLPIKVESITLMIASGSYWPNHIWSWVYLLETSNFQIANFKIELVNTLNRTRVTHVYPIATFQLLSWNFITIAIEAAERVYLYINREKTFSLRSFESEDNFQTETETELSIQFGSIPSALNNCPVIILDDISISDNNHSIDNFNKSAQMNFCPHDIEDNNGNLSCKCWNEYSLKTTDIDGMCRESVTCCVDFDECSRGRHMCPVSSVCINVVGSYVCQIRNGICSQMPDGKWVCQCNAGYTGHHCEIKQNVCKINLCRNGGSCFEYHNQITCLCLPEFAGHKCELKKLPNFILVLPKRPWLTKSNLTFVVYTQNIIKSFEKVFFVWNMGDGTASVNTSQLLHMPHGLIKFYKTLDMHLNSNVCSQTYGVIMVHSYTSPTQFNGSITIYNSYVISQIIPFHISVNQRERFCQPQLQLSNLFSKNRRNANINIRRSNLITSFVAFPSHCSSIKSINYTWGSNNVLLNARFRSSSNKNYIKIPKWSLPIGQTEISLEAQMETTDNEILLAKNTAMINVKSSIFTRQIYGGIIRTHPAETDAIIKVSPVSDEELINSNLTYNWSCWVEKGHPTDFCSHEETALLNHSSKLKISGNYLQKGMVYKVRVATIGPNGEQVGNHIQELRMTDTMLPSVYIKCIENCEYKSSPMINIILQVRPPHRRVSWSFSRDGASVYFNWKKNSCPTRFRNMLCIKPQAFPSGTVVDIKATLFTVQQKVEGEAVYQIQMTETIKPGKCFVIPDRGVTILDTFHVKCSDFDDGQSDLVYELYQRNIFTQQRILIERSMVAQFENLTLSTGDKDNRYRSELVIIATDLDQAQTRVSINVTVFPMSYRLGSKTVPIFLDILISDGVFTQLEKSGNLIGSVQLASAVANSLEIESLRNPADKTIKTFSEIRQSLAYNLKNSRPYDLETVQQSATVLEQILNTSIKQLNVDTQQLSIELAENLTDILQQEADYEHLDTTRRMNSTQSILRAVSDLLIARFTSVKPVLNLTQSGPSDYEDRDYFENSNDDILAQKSSSEFEVDLASRTFEIMQKLDKIVQGLYKLRLDTTIKGNKIRATVNSNIHRIITNNNDIYGSIKYDSVLFDKFAKTSLSLGIEKLDFNPLPHQSLSNTMNTPFVRVSIKNASMDTVDTAGQNLSVDLFLHRPNTQPTVKETIMYKLEKSKEIYVHKIDIPDVIGFAIIRIEPEDDVIQINVIVTYDHRPSMADLTNSSYQLPKDNVSSTGDDKYTITVPVTVETIEQEALYLGVIPVNALSSFKYELSVSFANCYFWDEEKSTWSTKGCTVGLQSNVDYLHCKCSHMSLFSGGIFICPNHIHPFLDIYLFLTIEENPIMIIVLACVYLIYFILLPIAWRFDRRNIKKEIAVLEDNEPDHKYFYLIVVSTGYQRGSGTTSHVAIQLIGDKGSSRTFVLGHPTQPILRQASIDIFLLTANDSVGEIGEILLFHDFSGNQPHWYLRQLIVYDCQLNKQWQFSVFRWLTVTDHATNVQFIFQCDQPTSISKVGFWELTSEKFCDEHLLYSVFNKPTVSRFTCVQRLACFLCIRLMTMLSSLMFYGIPRNDNSAQIEVGDFSFSLQQFIIGIESSLLVIPAAFVLAFLFRNSKLKTRPQISDIGPRHRIETNQNIIEDDETSKVTIFLDDVKYGSTPNPPKSTDQSTSQQIPRKFTLRKLLKSEVELPHQCLYLAWTLVILCCSISSYLMILYGLRYGRIKSLNWLVSSITALTEGVLLQQPLLIVIEITALTFIFKLSERSPSKAFFDITRIPTMERWRSSYFKFQRKRFYFPLPKVKLPEMQHKTIVRNKTSRRVIEIAGFCLFFVSLWTLVIQVKHPTAYQFTRYVKQTFINNYRFDFKETYHMKLNQVTSIPLIYKYLEGTVIEGVHTNQWKPLSESNTSLATDSIIQLLGVARLRQLRVRPDSCIPAKFLNETRYCASDYNSRNSDHDDYHAYWSPRNNDGNGSIMTNTPWKFTTGDYLLSHNIYGHLSTYSDYGYVADLGITASNSKQVVKYLQDHNWIDRFTRALFCEFTLFNVNINFFSQVTIVFEISASGSIIPDHRIWTFRPFGYFQQFTPTLVTAFIIFASLFVFYFAWEMVQIIQSKRSYFKIFWNYVDISILLCCLLLFISYGIYWDAVKLCVLQIRQAKRNVFVSFSPAVIWDTVSTSTFGVIVCLNMLKIWKLFSFNKRMHSFLLTIRGSAPSIFNFSIMYTIVLMAFAHSTYLILGPYDALFHSFGKNWLHYILFSFGSTSFDPYSDCEVVIGPIIFVLYTVTVYYYLMRMLEAIMIYSFKKVRREIHKIKNNYEMVKYIKEKFNIGVDKMNFKRNEMWLEIEQKLNEVNNTCELMIRKAQSFKTNRALSAST